MKQGPQSAKKLEGKLEGQQAAAAPKYESRPVDVALFSVRRASHAWHGLCPRPVDWSSESEESSDSNEDVAVAAARRKKEQLESEQGVLGMKVRRADFEYNEAVKKAPSGSSARGAT